MRNIKKEVCVLDTSVATSNVGDEIIMSSVRKELNSLFEWGFFTRLPTKEHIFRVGLGVISRSDYTFVGGTNFLSSFMNKFRAWQIWLWQAFLIREKIILMGVGWRDYQGLPNFYTKLLLKLVLDKKALHSVRDDYTKKKLESIGLKNVVNTACPTMWLLNEAHCNDIPQQKSERVVFTLTTYLPSLELDKSFVEILLAKYKEVVFWPQGRGDLDYFYSLELDEESRVKIISPNLESYDSYLCQNESDYIGTRLHGGIRAIQNKKRTLIIGVDNRAEEKKIDFNLNVVTRGDWHGLNSFIVGKHPTEIKIPVANINLWKEQFRR